MKIAILGYSGSGKSTLARKLGEQYDVPVLHFDRVQFRPNWEIRPQASKEIMTKTFLDLHKDWVIDGNYSKLSFERRMAEADVIILLLFGRFSCLYRVTHRYLKYKDSTRRDMADGCKEKLDREFVKWVLRDGRSKEVRERFQNVIDRYPNKTVVIKNQRQLNAVSSRIRKVLEK
jgi:adenylate kinase family enzyme